MRELGALNSLLVTLCQSERFGGAIDRVFNLQSKKFGGDGAKLDLHTPLATI